MPTLPKPAGPHSIATEYFHWTDPSDPDAPPLGLMIKLWYPIQPISSAATPLRRARYAPKTLIPSLQKLFKPVPKLITKKYMSAKTNAYTATPSLQKPTKMEKLKRSKSTESLSKISYIPILDQLLPVIIFSHGLYGIPEHYSNICENLASQGFIVIAPYHTDGSSAAVFYPDGQQLDFDYNRSNFLQEPTIEAEKGDEADEEDELLKLAEPKKDFQYRSSQLAIRVSNVSFILKKIAQYANIVDASFPPSGHMDLEKIGILGHSFGGATSVMSHLKLMNNPQLPQIRSCCALDSWMFPLAPLEEFTIEGTNPEFEEFRTLLKNFQQHPRWIRFINSDSWQWKQNVIRMRYIAELAGPFGIESSMEGTLHHNFNDIPLLMPGLAKMAKKIGTVDPKKQTAELNYIIFNFFTNTFNGLPVSVTTKSAIASVNEVVQTTTTIENVNGDQVVSVVGNNGVPVDGVVATGVEQPVNDGLVLPVANTTEASTVIAQPVVMPTVVPVNNVVGNETAQPVIVEQIPVNKPVQSSTVIEAPIQFVE